jgi:hypothetical protein
MNARNYIVKLNRSTIDFPALCGLGMQSILTMTDSPNFVNGKLILKITKTLLITESYNSKEYEVLRAQSVYEVPINDIKTKEDLYEFYKDAELNLSQTYQNAQAKIPLPPMQFPPEPIGNYQITSDSIFQFISSLN